MRRFINRVTDIICLFVGAFLLMWAILKEDEENS